MTRRTSLLSVATLVATAGAVLLIACAAPKSARQKTSTEHTPLPPTTPDRQEILDLESEMRQWRVELGLRPSPGAMTANGAAAEVCEGLDECKDACKLAEAICQNKDRICEIARDLDDDWATSKCEDARRSCDEAKEVCVCCQQRERNGLLPAQPCAPQPQPQPQPQPPSQP